VPSNVRFPGHLPWLIPRPPYRSRASRPVAQAALTTEDLEQGEPCRRSDNRLGFAYQIAFVRWDPRSPAQHSFAIIDELPIFTGAQLGR
jgi:hypothetical protein